jgi:hypothetical protein
VLKTKFMKNNVHTSSNHIRIIGFEPDTRTSVENMNFSITTT